MAVKKKAENLTIEEKLAQALVPESEQPYEVPKNWCWTTLDKVAIYKKGPFGSAVTKAMFVPKGSNTYKVYEQGNAIRKTVNYGEYYISESKFDELKSFEIKPGDFIVSCAGTVGETYKIPLGAECGIINQALMRIRLSEIVNDDFYLYYFDDVLRQDITGSSKGTAIKNIPPFAVLKGLPFPLPPFAEQKRIVERIESLFAKLDEAKEKLQEVLDGFETRRAAILHKAFSGELTAKWREEHGVSLDSWEKKKLGDCGILERGKSKHRPRNDERLFGGEYPFIQTGDIASANMYVVEHKQTLSEFGLQQSKLFPAGTLCITIAANIGDVAILSYDCCFPDSVVGVTPYRNVDSKFIYYMMSVLKKEIEDNAPATAQKNINLKILNDVVINLPDIDEQNTIVEIIDRCFEKEQQTNKAVVVALQNIEEIKRAILARAFRGELGTNDENDECAVELLKMVL